MATLCCVLFSTEASAATTSGRTVWNRGNSWKIQMWTRTGTRYYSENPALPASSLPLSFRIRHKCPVNLRVVANFGSLPFSVKLDQLALLWHKISLSSNVPGCASHLGGQHILRPRYGRNDPCVVLFTLNCYSSFYPRRLQWVPNTAAGFSHCPNSASKEHVPITTSGL